MPPKLPVIKGSYWSDTSVFETLAEDINYKGKDKSQGKGKDKGNDKDNDKGKGKGKEKEKDKDKGKGKHKDYNIFGVIPVIDLIDTLDYNDYSESRLFWLKLICDFVWDVWDEENDSIHIFPD